MNKESSTDAGGMPDYAQAFAQCCNCMLQDDALGAVWLLLREGTQLVMHQVSTDFLMHCVPDEAEMIVFDGGNSAGNRWKHVFFPRQRTHFFQDETLPPMRGSMRNETMLRTEDDFNDFTVALKERCLKDGLVLVQMRNGLWVEVMYLPPDAEDGRDAPGFSTADHDRYWYANGGSLRSGDWDLIEFR